MITVYEKPTCTTCRQLSNLLIKAGISFDKVNYYIEPLSEKEIKSLLKKMNMKASELLRKNEDAYKELKNKIDSLTENEIINLMAENPDLIQRPILEKDDKAILARPIENAREFLGLN